MFRHCSGSGKTTLLNVLAGRYKQSQLEVEGQILFHSGERPAGEMRHHYDRQDVVGWPRRLMAFPLTLGACEPCFIARVNCAYVTWQVGYVMQDDFLLPFLRVRETLRYAAALRMPSTVSPEEREGRVERIILELGLKECADTIVGDEHFK
jgi:ABC-type multidrug transport system ATPase subunit